MHICFLTPEYPPLPHGGIGTSIQNLGHELVKQGHQVTVLGWGDEWNGEDQGVRIRFLRSTSVPKMGWFLNRKTAANEINRMVHEDGLDIVEFPDWLGLSAGMKLDCPKVIRCHGSDTYFGDLLGYHPRWSIRQAERTAFHQAQSIASVSHYTAEVTSQLFGYSKPIRIIPNGINLDQFQSNPAMKEEDSQILYFGSMVRKKGVLDLAEIFSELATQDSSVRLLMVGRDSSDKLTGSLSTWRLLKEKITPENLSRIEYVGPKHPGELASFVRQATVCIFPSYAEALPLSWIEAMACGKAVIASNIGWAREVIEDGVSGILIHPSDHQGYVNALCDLLANPDKRIRIGLNARKRVEQLFSIQRTAELTLEWYKAVLDANH